MTEKANNGAGPSPRPTLAAAVKDVDRLGVAIVEAVLNKSETNEVRHRLWAVVKANEDAGPKDFVPVDADGNNARLLNLINWEIYFIELSARDMVLESAHHVIGERMLLSNYSANIMGPRAKSLVLRSDQGYVVKPWPPIAFAVNIGWIVHHFEAINGATRYVPASHRATNSPDPDQEYETLPIEGSAGSMIVIDGRFLYTSGANQTEDRQRTALFNYYTVPWMP